MATPNYRSGLEKAVGEILTAANIKFQHEIETLKYLKPEQVSKYSVDFFIPKAKKLIVESKGRFTSEDRKKMLLIKNQYPDRIVVMIFGRSQNTITKSSKTTYADWCDKHGILWIDIKTLKENPKCLLSLQKKAGKLSLHLNKNSPPLSKLAKKKSSSKRLYNHINEKNTSKNSMTNLSLLPK